MGYKKPITLTTDGLLVADMALVNVYRNHNVTFDEDTHKGIRFAMASPGSALFDQEH